MSIEVTSSRGKLTVFGLVMINVIAIDNLRSLTAGAIYGFSLVFFYLLATLFFFIPTILVTAELATGWPNTGGVYVWVREAFGLRLGFLAIWLQWIYNIVWFPTIFTFIASISAYLIDPQLANNKTYTLLVIIIAFWTVTWANLTGIKTAAWISTICAIVGTIFPMLLISILGFMWLLHGNESHINFSVKDFFPNMTQFANLAFLTNVLFGLMGIEMSAVHAGDVNNPKRDYPRALVYSGLIVLGTLVFACLSIAIVVPNHELNLVSGLIDAFTVFFDDFNLSWMIPIIAGLIVLGSLGGASAWILGPSIELLVATQDHDLPKFLRQKNKNNMPKGILITQGIIFTILCTTFFIMPTVSSSYWLLSNLTAILGLFFYILMFSAAIKLRYKYPKVDRAFKIPGGKLGVWLVCGIGILTCMVGISVGFIPPKHLLIGNVWVYELILILGAITLCLPPLLKK